MLTGEGTLLVSLLPALHPLHLLQVGIFIAIVFQAAVQLHFLSVTIEKGYCIAAEMSGVKMNCMYKRSCKIYGEKDDVVEQGKNVTQQT